MAAAFVMRAAVACCLCAIIFNCSVPAVSGAWPWEVSLPKNKTTTTEAPASKSATATTDAPSTTTVMPSTTEPTPRLRSRNKSNSRKHHLHTPKSRPPVTKDKDVDTTSTEVPPPSVSPAAVQTEPQLPASVQPQLPAVPPPGMSPIVIVEPDSYPDAGRSYRSMYEQPYGGMYPLPMPYASPMPYYSPLPPPPLPPYPSPYDPYAFGGYPSYQWPAIEPSYLRPYRSYPFAPIPFVGTYPSDYSPYSWWTPKVQCRSVGAEGAAAPGAQGGCTSEAKRGREELTPALMDAPGDQKVEEPSPTYVSLLPSYTGQVGTHDTPNTSNREETNVRIEEPYVVEQKTEQPSTALGNNAYGARETMGRENHILRNNPYQPAPPSPYWPGYYDQSQWNQWQQWPGSQQPQYPYGLGPQQPSVLPSPKRQVPAYGWGGRQYA